MTKRDDAAPPEPQSAARRALVRRWLLNFVLLLLIVGVGGYAWYRSRHPHEEAKPLLTNVDPKSVQTIEIERAREPLVQLERRDGEWRLRAPLAARADSFAVESLLRVLRAPIDSRITPADADLARYGLAPSALGVRFDNTEIRFGEMHPLKDETYVEVGSAVYLISNQYRAQVAAPYTNLIDGRLIEPDAKPIRFKLPDFTLTLKDGTWQREPPIASLSSDRINAFVDDWRHARALQVQKYSGKKPQAHVLMTFADAAGDKTERRFELLARTPELIVYRPDEGLEYHFPEDTAERLLHLDAPSESSDAASAKPDGAHDETKSK
jgi:hypothetical protein